MDLFKKDSMLEEKQIQKGMLL